MLTVKNFFDRPDIDNVDAVLIRNVSYLCTFSVDEFKGLYHLDKIQVLVNEKKFVIFSYLNSVGYVDCAGIPSHPVISLVTDAKGNLFYVLHEQGDIKTDLMFYKTSYKHSPNKSLETKQQIRSRGYSSDWQDYQEYINSSYSDAFEGDSDAYWNID